MLETVKSVNRQTKKVTTSFHKSAKIYVYDNSFKKKKYISYFTSQSPSREIYTIRLKISKNFFQSYILLIASMFDDKHTWSNSIIRFPRASNPICTSSSHTVKLVRRARHTTDHMYQILKFLDWPQLPLGIPNI